MLWNKEQYANTRQGHDPDLQYEIMLRGELHYG